jgi:hypothetical protein
LSDGYQAKMNSAILVNESTSDGSLSGALRLSRVEWLVAAALMTSGFIHLAMLAIFGGSWDGPLSLRKPLLFVEFADCFAFTASSIVS